VAPLTAETQRHLMSTFAPKFEQTAYLRRLLRRAAEPIARSHGHFDALLVSAEVGLMVHKTAETVAAV